MVHKERLIGTHFFSPAHITPLVEVIPSPYTAKEVANDIMLFLQDTKKKTCTTKTRN